MVVLENNFFPFFSYAFRLEGFLLFFICWDLIKKEVLHCTGKYDEASMPDCLRKITIVLGKERNQGTGLGLLLRLEYPRPWATLSTTLIELSRVQKQRRDTNIAQQGQREECERH